jgi:hypothetical protein
MPAQYKMNDLPEPMDAQVKLVELPPTLVATLRFSGSTNDAAVAGKASELAKVIQSSKWKVSGSPAAFFYNPPWTIPFLRTNEVVIPVSKYSN